MELKKSEVIYNRAEDIHDKMAKFLKKSEDYIINFQYMNMNRTVISYGCIPSDGREDKSNKEEFNFYWQRDYTCQGSITFPYNEVLRCYFEEDEWGQISVDIILNGIIIGLECCGIRG